MERFPLAGHFRSFLITTSWLATATPAWPAAQTPGDSGRQTRDSRWGPGTSRGRDMGPPPSRAAAGMRLHCARRARAPLRSVHSSTLFPLSLSSLPRLGAPPLPSPPVLPSPLSPGRSGAPLLPPASFLFLPPSPKSDSLVRMGPHLRSFHQGLNHIPPISRYFPFFTHRNRHRYNHYKNFMLSHSWCRKSSSWFS